LNKFLTQRLLVPALFAVSLLASAGYAQQQPAAGAAGPAAVHENPGRPQHLAADPFARTELFFGRNKPDGTEVTKKEFDEFLAEVITPRFPDGLTVLEGRGQFLNSDGVVEKERSILLILLYPIGARQEKNLKIEEIRNLYKDRFNQQSVLRVDNPLPVWVSF
jgi:hypothetical protein